MGNFKTNGERKHCSAVRILTVTAEGKITYWRRKDQ